MVINPALKTDHLAALYAPKQRIHIPDFLQADFRRELLTEIEAGLPWQVSLDSQGKGINVEYGAFQSLDDAQRRALETRIYAQARTGFQYCYDSYRLSDEVEAGHCPFPVLRRLYESLNSPQFFDFVAALTGETQGRYCDAQVTRYRAGQFLTTHSDLDERKGRLFAFVINLTPQWRSDWGGLLQFLGPDGHIETAFMPHPNALNLFRVPQPHAVSIVTPFAGAARLSITGWIRLWPDR